MAGKCREEVVEALLAGSRIEPLLHPKPGAVTRIARHSDKDVVDYSIDNIALSVAAHSACSAARVRCRGSIALAMKRYRILRGGLGLSRVNTSLGTLLLIVPLAAAHGLTGDDDIDSLVDWAAWMVRECTGVEETREYYSLLRAMAPRHLGEYRGPVESVWDEPRTSFAEVLNSVRWDHVHRELLDGYPITLEVLGIIEDSSGSLEDRALSALLHALAVHGDTLIARRWGWRAFKTAMAESRWALLLSAKWGARTSLEMLDRIWRPRGWNPGSILDILAAALGLYLVRLAARRV